jgi:dUTP pyrophosphatase
MKIKVQKLKKDAKLPIRGHEGDAGIDFYAVEKVFFKPGEQMRVHTGIAIEIPKGYVGLIWDKSSISFNHGLKIMGGVIDSGYRGEIIMNLLNTSDKEFVLKKRHKVAQMIVQKFEDCDIEEVLELSETKRGHGREGRTGFK